MFGIERMQHIHGVIKDAEDQVDVCKRGCIGLLDTSGFYDDPRDKRRTLSNLEECAYAYINRWRWDHPVWMRDPSDPTSDIGIEIPFDLVVRIDGPMLLAFRFTGRIDGIHYDGLGRLTVHDNKTASRLGDAWTQSQMVSHQYTGYCIAASVFTQDVVNSCDVLGLLFHYLERMITVAIAREQMEREPYHLQAMAYMVDTYGAHGTSICR